MNIFSISRPNKTINFLLYFSFLIAFLQVNAQNITEQNKAQEVKVLSAKKINATAVELVLSGNQKLTIDFYAENIFRLFQDNSGGLIRDPEAKPMAKILVENPRRAVTNLTLNENNQSITLSTSQLIFQINKNNSLIKVTNPITNSVVLEELLPINFENGKVTMVVKESPQEYFYGGGVQNGRFSHKGKVIAIANQNSWTDGGVASPNPFYWSTEGYAIMWHTFKKGSYDFGSKQKGIVKIMHETPYLDAFIIVGDGAVPLLNGFYQLTGNPVLLPKFGFYEGHLNAYNRDFWKEDEKGVLFEDGKRYWESQKDNGGIKESLN
jgi:alpha-glucosidase (family GH31 glycosyl hydrolase)